ncbi:autophagy-related protein 13-domain-containing protein [Coemansia spiralis]|nr:autophagy-related protein 13-domain-containing protein [Coemansia spiralis]
MTQRSFFWPRNGSSTSDKAQQGRNNTENATENDTNNRSESLSRSRTPLPTAAVSIVGSSSTRTHTSQGQAIQSHNDNFKHSVSIGSSNDGHGSRQPQNASSLPLQQQTAHPTSHAPLNAATYLQSRLPPNSGSPSAGIAAPSSFSSSYSSSPSPSPSINPYAGAIRSMLHATHSSASTLAEQSSKAQADSTAKTRATAGSTLPANLHRTNSSRTYSDSAPPLPPRYLEGGAYSGNSQHQLQHNPGDIKRQSLQRASPKTRQEHVAIAPASTPTAAASASTAPATAAPITSHGSRDTRCEQIVQNFYSKAAQIVAHLRGHGIGSSRYSHDVNTDFEAISTTLPQSRLMTSGATGQSTSSAMYASSASSSVIDVGSTGRRVNKWFNINLEDIVDAKEEAKFWRHAVTTGAHAFPQGPPPMFIEVCLDVSAVSPSDELQVTDIFGRPWSVDLELVTSNSRLLESQRLKTTSEEKAFGDGRRGRQHRASTIVLEVWRLDLDINSIPQPAPDLPRVYKQAIVFFRSLYSFANLLPCTSLQDQLNPNGINSESSYGRKMSVFYSFGTEMAPRSSVIDLDVSLTGTEKFLESHSFEPVSTPMGTFFMSVQYRRESSFSCAAQHSPLPHDNLSGIGAIDDTYFTPTLSSRSGSHFSPTRQHNNQQQNQEQHDNLAGSVTSPQSAASNVPWYGPMSLLDNTSNLHHPHGSSITSDRSVTMPSVNPFRTRPLSMGNSSSLPNYVSDIAGHKRVPTSRLSSEWQRPGDLYSTHEASRAQSSRTSLRRVSIGARGSIVDHGQGSQSHDGHISIGSSNRHGGSGGHTVSVGIRPHSLDHKADGIIGRLSTSGATDSGSMLHRSVMLRRFGDSLSPTESHKTGELGSRISTATAATESSGSGPISPPKPTILGPRSTSSGNTGSSVTGRSGLGFTPFKSPSLSESPGKKTISSFAEVSELVSASSLKAVKWLIAA